MPEQQPQYGAYPPPGAYAPPPPPPPAPASGAAAAGQSQLIQSDLIPRINELNPGQLLRN